MEDGSKVGNEQRKTLADISNLPQQNQDKRLEPVSINAKDYINRLHQENLSLVKLIADRNKIIQSHAFQLQKLRIECQQLQQKNLQLAQSNSQMLAELNSSKDRLKVLQHELECKNISLKIRELETEDTANVGRYQIYGTEVETMAHDRTGKFCQADNRDNEPCNKKRRRKSKSLDPTTFKQTKPKERTDKNRQSATFRAREQETTDDMLEICDALDTVGEPIKSEKNLDNKRHCSRRKSSRLRTREQESADGMFEINDALDVTTVKPVQIEMKVDNKRHGSRRQSARFKCREQVQEAPEGLFQKDDAKFPISSLHECGPTSPVSSLKDEVDNKRNGSGRQSARFKRGEQVQEAPEGLFQKDDAKFPNFPLREYGPTSSVSSLKDETEAVHSASGFKAQELQTSSLRPKRQAAEKIQSYKEIPINVKMRRTE